MNLEELQERKLVLQNKLNEMSQNYHILSGHINEIHYLIEELEKKKEKVESEVNLGLE